jgi:hypothetical protein
MLTALFSAFALVSASAAAPAMPVAPLDAYQQARLAALLVWAEAYRSCYEPEPFSLTIDRHFTATCIKRELAKARHGASSDEQAALAGLIEETPHLMTALNAPHSAAPPVDVPPRTAGRDDARSRVQD